MNGLHKFAVRCWLAAGLVLCLAAGSWTGEVLAQSTGGPQDLCIATEECTAETSDNCGWGTETGNAMCPDYFSGPVLKVCTCTRKLTGCDCKLL
jgi:hypothetical protein